MEQQARASDCTVEYAILVQSNYSVLMTVICKRLTMQEVDEQWWMERDVGAINTVAGNRKMWEVENNIKLS